MSLWQPVWAWCGSGVGWVWSGRFWVSFEGKEWHDYQGLRLFWGVRYGSDTHIWTWENNEDRYNGSCGYGGAPRLRKQLLDIREGSGGKRLGRISKGWGSIKYFAWSRTEWQKIKYQKSSWGASHDGLQKWGNSWMWLWNWGGEQVHGDEWGWWAIAS